MTTRRFAATATRFALTFIALVCMCVVWTASAVAISLNSEHGSTDVDFSEWRLWGGVTIKLEEWVITGEEGVCDFASGSYVVSGGVEIQTPDGVFTGDEAAYTETDGILTLDKGRFAVEIGGAEKPIYFAADEVTMGEQSSLLSDSIVTTCDLPHPHWYLKSKTIELWPSDRVVLHGVTLWEFGFPLFYWPRLTLPLREGAFPELPKIGYTAETGLYLLLAHRYGDECSGGKLSFDLYQRTGLGAGVEHREELSDRLAVEGSAYLFRYWGGDKYWARVSGGVTSIVSDHLTVSASVAYKPEMVSGVIDKDEIQVKTSLSYSKPGTRATLGYGHTGSTLPRVFTSQTLDAALNHQFSDGLSVDGRLSAAAKTGHKTDLIEVDETLINYLARARYRAGSSTLSLTVEDWTEATTSYYSITRKKRLVRKPELSLDIRQVKVPWSTKPVSIELSLGDYGYSSTGSSNPELLLRDWRALAGVSQPLTRFANLGSLSFWYSYSAGYRYYGSGAEMAFISPRVGADVSSGGFTGSLTRSITVPYGYTPLVFDEEAPEDRLTARVSYAFGRLTASIQSSADLLTNKLDPIALWLRYVPEDKLALDLSYRHDIVNQRPYSAIIRYSDRRDEDRLLRLGVDYSLASSAVSRAEAEVSYKLTDRLRLVTAISYNGSKEEWNRGDVALVADLHCRELSLRYDIGKRQVWVEYRLFAFPGDPIKVGLDEDEGVLLDSSIFSTQ